MNGKLGAIFKGVLTAVRGAKVQFLVRSHWDIECYDKHGKLKYTDHAENCCTAEGLTKLLNVMFHAAAAISTWYIAIFEDNHTPVDGDTYAVPGYTECTAYDEPTRPEFVEAEAAAKTMSNTLSKATFTINDTKTLYGAALVGGGSPANGKGDTGGGGVLYAAAKFTSGKPVEDDDTFKVTCTLTASDVV
jgi:hypothetical protein